MNEPRNPTIAPVDMTLHPEKGTEAFFLDVSARPALIMRGIDVRDLLHRISTNDLRLLSPSQPVQTIFTNEKGKIIDIVSIIDTGDGRFLLAGQAGNSGRLAQWLEKYIIMEDARIEPADLRHFLVKGLPPNCEELLKSHVSFRDHWGSLDFVHVLPKSSEEGTVRGHLSAAGLKEMDAGKYDEFRIANGIPVFPNEFSLDVNPLEAGLRHLISWSKGCYIGQEVIARLDTYGKVQRKLVRLESEAEPGSLPASLTDGREDSGQMTSAVGKGEKGRFIGLGYIKSSVPDNAVLFLGGSRDKKVRISPL